MEMKLIKKIVTISLILLFITMICTKSLAGITPGDITGDTPGSTNISFSFVDELINIIRTIRNIYSSRSDDGHRN